MKDILVIGVGFMGGGITQVVAQSGYNVKLYDKDPGAIEKTLNQIKWSTEKLESKGKLKDTAKAIQDRITTTSDYSTAPKCKFVIEAVYEDIKLKNGIFRELDEICPPDVILASNSSSIPTTILAEGLKYPDRLVGLLFGPVPMIRLVEVVKGQKTSDTVFKEAVEFIESIGQYPVKVMKDVPGFIMNRINGAAFKEALSLVEQGIASVEDVDKGMHYGFNWNIGPFEIVDNAGLDVKVRVSKQYEALGAGDIALTSTLLERMIKAGRIGRKVGKGFYDYAPDGKMIPFDVSTI